MLINIDNGGTFTDLWALSPRESYRTKTRTTQHDLSECLFAGLKSLSEEVYGSENLQRLLSETRYIRYSTTQGTNALVQRRGPRIGLVLLEGTLVTDFCTDEEAKGIFDALVGDRIVYLNEVELAELTVSDLGSGNTKPVLNAVTKLTAGGANRIVVSLGGHEAELGFLRTARIRFPEHLLGTVPVLAVSDVAADENRIRGTWTAILNAFLHPAMERFLYNAEHRLQEMNFRAPLLVFRNDGMAGRVAKTAAIKTYGSGPEGGMSGAVAFAKLYSYDHFVTIDVGGTTTDIGVVEHGEPLTHRWGHVESVEVSIPLSELRSIGVGGGSIIKADGTDIKVGPQSVGAAPGPACFGYGGTEATITDVKFINGVIDSEQYFGGKMNLDLSRAESAVKNNVADPLGLSVDEAAHQMDAAWVNAVAESLKKQLKPNTVLGGFGGAGPFSVCAIADACGVKEIMVPGMAAVFSATGIAQSDIGHRFDAIVIGGDAANEEKIKRLTARAGADMYAEGFDFESCHKQWTVCKGDSESNEVTQEEIEHFLTGLAKGEKASIGLVVSHIIDHNPLKANKHMPIQAPVSDMNRTVKFEVGKSIDVPVFELSRQSPGAQGKGPAIIEDDYFTLPVLAGWNFNITANGDIELSK
jgi:N-methylhydantoinase A/oxoprolinase/acetone carboxylase beta subunit